jgi:enoyl-CoA hydratase/carnithine racemase
LKSSQDAVAKAVNFARFFADAGAPYSYEGTYQMQNLIVRKAITGHGAFVRHRSGRHFEAGSPHPGDMIMVLQAAATATVSNPLPRAALALANVQYEKKGSIAYVTVNRPKVLNALNTPTWTDLRAAFEDVKADASVHGVILTGAGDKAFIAGADISELAHVDAFDAEESSRFGQGVLDLIENLGKPVIAAINGFALGGGCETAMACTLRIAVEHAKFGQPEVKLGLLPGGGGTQRLPRLVGKGRALQLILTGETISAQEAYRIGLVNEVVPAANLIVRAETILKQIAANAPIAVKFSLEAANKGMDTSQAEGFALEASYFGICAATEDKKEGTSAFLEKRAPQFRGR